MDGLEPCKRVSLVSKIASKILHTDFCSTSYFIRNLHFANCVDSTNEAMMLPMLVSFFGGDIFHRGDIIQDCMRNFLIVREKKEGALIHRKYPLEALHHPTTPCSLPRWKCFGLFLFWFLVYSLLILFKLYQIYCGYLFANNTNLNLLALWFVHPRLACHFVLR